MRTYIANLAFLTILLSPHLVKAVETCGVAEPWTFSDFDTFYNNADGCPTQGFISDAWGRYSFTEDNWRQYGMDEDSCNINTPLARTWQALRLLAFAGSDTPNCDYSAAKTTDWAYCWAGNQIDELLVECNPQNPNAIARTVWGTLRDNFTALHRAFFYGNSVPWRAASIFHEARHAEDECRHVDNCPAGVGACDHAFDDGCWGGKGQGAYTYTAVWLEWFFVQPQPRMTDVTISGHVLDQVNSTLARHFEVDPCFRVMEDGTRMIGVDKDGNPIPGC